MDLKGKVILITGAGSGIGQGIAELLAEHGATLILLGRSLQKLVAVQNNLKTTTESYSCDLTDIAQVKKTLGHIAHKGHRFFALINNAGIFDQRSFIDSSDELWQKHFEANLLGPARLTRECLNLMEKNATIINISSTLGVRPVAKTAVYSSMKAATVSWTKVLALELATQGVRVNAICPGLVDTPIHGGITDETRSQMNMAQPLGRIGTPRDIAEGVVFLLKSPWTTGTVLTIDGGIQL